MQLRNRSRTWCSRGRTAQRRLAVEEANREDHEVVNILNDSEHVWPRSRDSGCSGTREGLIRQVLTFGQRIGGQILEILQR